MPTFQVNHDKLLQLSSHITYGSRGIIPVMIGQLDREDILARFERLLRRH